MSVPPKSFAPAASAAVVVDPEEAQTPQHTGTFAWGGVFGSHWFVDPV